MPGPCVRGIGLSPVQQVASGGKAVPALPWQTGRSSRLLPRSGTAPGSRRFCRMTKRERLPDKFLKTIHPCRDCSGGGEIVNNGLVRQTLLRRELLLSEPVCCAYEDDERIAAAAVEHGLVFQTCGDVPAARDVEVETTADAHAECPVLDVIGDNAHLGIDAPPVGDAEYVVGVEIDVDRTVLFRQDIDRRFDTPVAPLLRKAISSKILISKRNRDFLFSDGTQKTAEYYRSRCSNRWSKKGGARISTEQDCFSLICNILRVEKACMVSYFCPTKKL